MCKFTILLASGNIRVNVKCLIGIVVLVLVLVTVVFVIYSCTSSQDCYRNRIVLPWLHFLMLMSQYLNGFSNLRAVHFSITTKVLPQHTSFQSDNLTITLGLCVSVCVFVDVWRLKI